MNSLISVQKFGRSLADTILWLEDLEGDVASDVGDRLWSPALRPRELPERPSYADILEAYNRPVGGRGLYLDEHTAFWKFPQASRELITQEVVEARRGALAVLGRHPPAPNFDLAGGRLLLFDPDASLADAAAEEVTSGFFNWENLPAWDTWIEYLRDPTRDSLKSRLRGIPDNSWTSIHFTSYLVAWVPPTLVTLVNSGIEANPEGSIQWVETADTDLTQFLE